MQLPRLPGAPENRWAHLLSGTPEAEAAEERSSGKTALEEKVDRLQSELTQLKMVVEQIRDQLRTP